LGKVTSMHNNPAVLSACSIALSTAVMAIGAIVHRKRNNNHALASANRPASA